MEFYSFDFQCELNGHSNTGGSFQNSKGKKMAPPVRIGNPNKTQRRLATLVDADFLWANANASSKIHSLSVSCGIAAVSTISAFLYSITGYFQFGSGGRTSSPFKDCFRSTTPCRPIEVTYRQDLRCCPELLAVIGSTKQDVSICF